MSKLIPMVSGFVVLSVLFCLIDGVGFPGCTILSLCVMNQAILVYLLDHLHNENPPS